jgi:GNAT superfamily N-acetyltransferase
VARAERARAAGYVVRDARLADAAEIGPVHIQVWREAYAGLMPAEYLAALDPQASAGRWAEMLSQPADGVRRLVGVAPTGEVVAIAAAGPSRDDDPPTAWELWVINVLAAHHGSGIADLLMGQLVGVRPASLWVLRGNERAMRFYGRHGFQPDGAVKFHEATATAEDRWVRRTAQSG